MPGSIIPLSKIFEGWEGYNTSLVHSIQPLTQEQLTRHLSAGLRSAGELASHIAMGRVGWFSRMPAPASQELIKESQAAGSEAGISSNKDDIIHWLGASWQMVASTLAQWTVDDLCRTYRMEYGGKVFMVSYQWTIWRILTHDVHHGGELALVLGMQGIRLPELGDLGGHLVWPSLAPDQ